MNTISFIGFFLVAVGLRFFVKKSPEQAKRDEWLLQWFGKEGMKNWLRTAKLSDELKNLNSWYEWNSLGKPKSGHVYLRYMKAQRAADKSRVKYGFDCFNAPSIRDGVFRGLVTTGSWDYKEKNQNPPWEIHYDYEPRGADWIAAGYLSNVTLPNGRTVNPIAMYVKNEGGIVFGY